LSSQNLGRSIFNLTKRNHLCIQYTFSTVSFLGLHKPDNLFGLRKKYFEFSWVTRINRIDGIILTKEGGDGI
jgi:hypothetical protein